MRKRPKARTPTQIVVDRMRQVRERQGLSAQALGDRMAALGMPDFNRAIVANLETGRRESISVDELLVLALALGVAPIHLLVPPEDDGAVQVGSQSHDAATVRAWVRGTQPLGSDGRVYFTEIPDAEWDETVRQRLTDIDLYHDAPQEAIARIMRLPDDLRHEMGRQLYEAGIGGVPSVWADEDYPVVINLLGDFERQADERERQAD